MPTFEFTSPEGKTYEVQGPEGATKAQAFEILQQRLGGEKPSGPAAPQSTFGRNIGLGTRDVLTGLGSAVQSPFEAVGGFAKGAAELVGAPQAGAAMQRAIVPSNLGEMASNVMGLPTPQTEREQTQSRIQRGVTEVAAPMTNMGTVNLLKGGAKLAGEAGGKALKALTPELNPELVSLAQKATERGIPLRPDMLMDNKVAKFVGSALEEKVPFSGGKGDVRQQAFNRAVAESIGLPELPSGRLTYTEYAKAMDKTGSQIGELASKNKIPFDAGIQQRLNALRQDPEFAVKDVQDVLKARMKELSTVAKNNGGVIDGKTFAKIQQSIGAQIRRINPQTGAQTRYALDKMEDTMLDSIRASLTADEKAAFDTARMQYSNGKTIEPLIAKKGGTTGDISPQGLATQMSMSQRRSAMAKGRAGDLGDLARIGQAFIKEPETSISATKAATYGALAPTMYLEPMSTTGVVGAANLYNRLAPGMTRSLLTPPTP